MVSWSPIRNITHYSLLRGFSKPEALAKACSVNGYKACGITDYKTISGAVSFYRSCKKYKIKPIIGCSFDKYTLLAKNKHGWNDLIELVSNIGEDGDIPTGISKIIFSRHNLICLSDIKMTDIFGEDAYAYCSLLKCSYYTEPADAIMHRILLCSSLKTTIPKIQKQLRQSTLSEEIITYFTDQHHLLDSNAVSQLVNENPEDITVIEEIVNKCEDYNILSTPILPKFKCPNGKSEADYLKQLCRSGWRSLLIEDNKVSDEQDKKKYAERFDEEFNIIEGANLFGYFLIVQDILAYVKSQGWMSGPGRGSAAGCLISYLIGITKIDPLEFNLLFSRFYNAGRNTENHISLPDIDMDVPAQRRDEIITYLKNKYGYGHVSQMITFGRLRGRSAIKEVLRINEACSFTEMNTISKYIPNEAEISDQLAEMDDDDRSIIRWALMNNSSELRDFCHINENNELEGEYAEYFNQAIRLEGTFKTQGKHAAGVVISSQALSTVCPMVKQKGSDEKIAGLEMSDLEALGHVKFDVLGITLLDKLMFIKDLIEHKI